MKVSNLVPEVYYKKSRDFSYIGRVFEVLFNYYKTNVDLVGKSPLDENVMSNIISLAAMTLGFESKHEYINKDLVALCSSFAMLLKNKGTITAIEDCVNILLHTQNIQQGTTIVYDVDNLELTIYVPSQVKDIVLLEDVFEYILPAGVTYSFILSGVSNTSATEHLVETDSVEIYKSYAHTLAQVSGGSETSGRDVNSDESQYVNRSITYTGTVPGNEVVPESEVSN